MLFLCIGLGVSVIEDIPSGFTGYKLVRQFSLPVDTVHLIWLPPRRVSAGSNITQTVSAGSNFSRTVVLEGSKRSRTVLADAKYDGQSQQEAKIGGVLFTL